MIDIFLDIPEADRHRAVYVLDLLMNILGLAYRYLDTDEAGPADGDEPRGDVLLYDGDLRDPDNFSQPSHQPRNLNDDVKRRRHLLPNDPDG